MPNIEEMMRPQPMVGIQLQPIDEALRERLKLGDTEGVLVAEVTADGPAAKAGVMAEDVITTADGKATTNPEELKAIVRGKKKGDVITFTLVRAGEQMEKKVEVDERPLAVMRMPPGSSGNFGMPMFDSRLEGMHKRLQELEERFKDSAQEGVENFKDRSNDRLQNLEKRLTELEKKISDSSTETIDRLQKAVDELSQKVDNLAPKN